MKTLIMIGAGHSHLVAIGEILPKASKTTRVILVSDVSLAPYSGMLPGFLAGFYEEKEILFDLEKLRNHFGFELILDAAVEINSAQNSIRLSSGSVLTYDCLSINTGIWPTPLLTDKSSEERIIYAKPLSHLIPKWNQFLNTKNHMKIAVVGAGSAGIEVVSALAMRKKGVVTLFSKTENILPELSDSVRKKTVSQLTQLEIKIESLATVTSYFDNNIRLEDGRHFPCDFVFVTTGAQPHPIKGDLACDTKGYLETNKALQVKTTQNVFAAGDCITFDNNPLPKAGVFAVRQGKVLAYNLLAFIKNSQLKEYSPQKSFLKILMIGPKLGLATKGQFHYMGALAWKLKEFLDRKFMNKYQKS